MAKKQNAGIGLVSGVIVLIVIVLGGLFLWTQHNQDVLAREREAKLNQLETKQNADYQEIQDLAKKAKDDQSTSTINTQNPAQNIPAIDTTKVNTKIFLSKNPDSSKNPVSTMSVTREIGKSQIYQNAVSKVLEGPTSQEQSQGLFTPLQVSGSSTCAGNDFTTQTQTINPNKIEVTIRFCRDVKISDEQDTTRITNVLSQTIQGTKDQTSQEVTKVIILTKDGHCFGDDSGYDACLTK